jgi:hypothetical protein
LDLNPINLQVLSEKVFQEADFWHLVELHKGAIRDIKFEFITPNMSNISKPLSEELKSFAEKSNATKTDLKIYANPNSSVILDIDDPEYMETIRGLVKYSSEGGGDVSLKIRSGGSRKHTKQSKKTVKTDAIERLGLFATNLLRYLMDLFRDE